MLTRVRSFLTHTPALAVVVLLLLAGLPALGLNSYWQRQLVLIAIYTLLCSGLNLSFGYAGELALGQVAIFAVGAYTSAILYNNGYTDIIVAFFAAVVFAGLAGLISGIPGLRLGHWSLALVSFFFVLLIPSLTQIFSDHTGGSIGLTGIIGPTLLGYELSSEEFYVVAIVVTGLWMMVFRNLILSRFGTFLKVLAESPTLAEALGGSVYRLRVQAYVIGALPAGLAGVLYTYLTGFLSPDAFVLTVLFAILAATVVGGADSIWGAPIGAALLVLGPLQATSFEKYSTAVYGVFLIVVGGLFAAGLAGLVRTARNRIEQRVWRRRHASTTPPRGSAGDVSLPIPGERLEVAGVRKSFTGLTALDGVDLVIEPGTVTAIIGPNGAGKTTLLNVISGVVKPDSGEVRLAGRSLADIPTYRVSRIGVGRTFQTPMIPASMSVLEVVESGRLRQGRIGFWSAILRLPRFYRLRATDRNAARAALSFAGLEHLAEHNAGKLPLGTRRLLEVVRAVAGEPHVLLLDEPAAGLDDDGLAELKMLISRTRDAGGTVVLVEHNVPFVMDVADVVHVMELGRVIASGPPDAIRTNQRVIDSYLGRRAGAAPVSVSTSRDGDAKAD